MNNYSILFIGGGIDIGGAGKMLKYVANICVDHFGSVTILSCKQTERPQNIDGRIVFDSTRIFKKMSLWERIKIMCDFRSIIKKKSPDLVCAFTSEYSVMSRIATFGINTKFVSAERCDPYSLPFIWKLLASFSYLLSDACIFQLEGARDFFCKKIRERSYVIPNPYVLPCEVKPFKGKRNLTIVSAGRFQPEKRFDVLIDAYAKVVQKHPEFSLILYGEGPLMKDYQKQLKKYRMSDKVRFPGYVSNVAERIREDGIFVLSSLLEGIPNVLIEALSVGIPSVATNCSPGGPAFLLNNGERGLLVPVNDSVAMSEAIIKLIEDIDLYKRFENAGPEIRHVLDSEIISEEWLKTFDLILNNQ